MRYFEITLSLPKNKNLKQCFRMHDHKTSEEIRERASEIVDIFLNTHNIGGGYVMEVSEISRRMFMNRTEDMLI